MKSEWQTALIILLLGLGFQHTPEAQGDTGFLEGLGNAFKQMGSDIKDVVQGHSQGEANQTWVEDATVNASDPSPAAGAQDRQLIKEIQYRLSALGYLPGSVDGLMSKQTAFAIRKYQRTSGIAVDGMPSAQLLALLRSVTSDIKIPADIATTQSQNSGISSSIGSAFTKVTGSISNALGTSNTNALVEVAKQTALAAGLNQAAMSGVPREAIAAAAGLGQSPSTYSPLPNVLANTNQLLTMGRASSGSSQSYLDRMVAEQEAMVYQRAQNISPYDREIARRSGIDLDSQVARQLEGYEKYKRDAEEINRLTSVQAIPATGTSSTAPGQALPNVLAGRWEGKVTYNPKDISSTLPGRSGQQTRVRLDVDPQRGLLAATYPDLGCQGILRANSSVPAKAGVNQHELSDYPLEERLAAGSNCTDGGTVYLSHWSAYQTGQTAKKGQLMFKWAHPTTKKPAMFGRLLPVSDVIDKKAIDEIASKADPVSNPTSTASSPNQNHAIAAQPILILSEQLKNDLLPQLAWVTKKIAWTVSKKGLEWLIEDGRSREVFKLIFNGTTATLSDAEKLKRLKIFEEALDDPQFMQELNQTINNKFALKLSTAVMESITQAILIKQMAPIVEAVYGRKQAEYFEMLAPHALFFADMAASTSAASPVGLILKNIEIWVPNIVGYTKLGEELYQARQTGTDLTSSINNALEWQRAYSESLAKNKVVGSVFGDAQGMDLTPKMRKYFSESLAQAPSHIEEMRKADNHLKWVQNATEFYYTHIVKPLATAAESTPQMTGPINAINKKVTPSAKRKSSGSGSW